MTEQSKTVTLFAPEWQAICIGSANQLAGFFGSTAGLTDEHLAAIDTHIERLRTFARAWRAVSSVVQAPPPPPTKIDPDAHHPGYPPGHPGEPPVLQPNGADLSPRTGKPKRAYNRKPKPEAQIQQ